MSGQHCTLSLQIFSATSTIISILLEQKQSNQQSFRVNALLNMCCRHRLSVLVDYIASELGQFHARTESMINVQECVNSFHVDQQSLEQY